MLLIWWTNKKDCEIMGRDIAANAPVYLYELYHTRYLRTATCKLWKSEKRTHRETFMQIWPSTEFSEQMRLYYDGIVIEHKDYNFCPYGVFTDDKLKIYTIDEIKELL